MKGSSPQSKDGNAVAWLSLFTSSTTLICCALPALLVTIGAGAVLASAVSVFPQLVIFSEYKTAIFGVTFLMLAGNGILYWRRRHQACSLGLSPEQVRQCAQMRKFSWRIYWLSVALFIVGGWFAFVQPWLSQ
jgi:hypothetical protein